MSSQWINHVKELSKKHNIKYNESLKNKQCKSEYHKMKGGGLFDMAQNAFNISSMPPNVKNLLDKYGDAKINYIKLNRSPVQGSVQFLLNKFSKNGNNFQKELSKLPYESIYHLQMIFSTVKGRVVLEKNERLNMAERPKETETININFNPNLTIRQIYNNGLKLAGDKLFYTYNASSNNCQNFILFLLKGSQLDTPENIAFTKQDTSTLFQKDPKLRKIANSFVKIGAIANTTMSGGKIQYNIPNRKIKFEIK